VPKSDVFCMALSNFFVAAVALGKAAISILALSLIRPADEFISDTVKCRALSAQSLDVALMVEECFSTIRRILMASIKRT